MAEKHWLENRQANNAIETKIIFYKILEAKK